MHHADTSFMLGIVIRWRIVAFATMLFWSWYFAPSLLALQ
jgi:hypothetical protein